jgi:hypothetical protein
MRTSREDGSVTPVSWQGQPVEANQEAGRVKLIRCECGFVARGDSDDQVVGVLRGHLATDHPALLDTVSQEDLLSWIEVE